MPAPKLALQIVAGGKSFEFKVTPDTGTTCTVVAADILQVHDVPFIPSSSNKLFNASGAPMSCEGTIDLSLSIPACGSNRAIATQALVSSDLSNEILLSYKDQVDLKILPNNYPNVIAQVKADTLTSIKAEFKDVLSDDLSSL